MAITVTGATMPDHPSLRACLLRFKLPPFFFCSLSFILSFPSFVPSPLNMYVIWPEHFFSFSFSFFSFFFLFVHLLFDTCLRNSPFFSLVSVYCRCHGSRPRCRPVPSKKDINQELNMCLNFSICNHGKEDTQISPESSLLHSRTKAPRKSSSKGGRGKKEKKKKKKKETEPAHLCTDILFHLLPLDTFLAPGPPRKRYHTHPLPDHDLASRPFDRSDLFGVVGQKPDPSLALGGAQRAAEPEIDKHCGREAVAARIGWVAQEQVRLQRVVAQVLEVVRFELRKEAYASTFLTEVDYHAWYDVSAYALQPKR